MCVCVYLSSEMSTCAGAEHRGNEWRGRTLHTWDALLQMRRDGRAIRPLQKASGKFGQKNPDHPCFPCASL